MNDNQVIWIPTKSVDKFEYGKDINNYLSALSKYSFREKETESDWDTYEIDDGLIEVYAGNDKIESICCRVSCLLNGFELIGANFSIAKTRELGEPDRMDQEYLFGSEELQNIYEYDQFGAQVWVSKGEIVAVFSSEFIADDEV